MLHTWICTYTRTHLKYWNFKSCFVLLYRFNSVLILNSNAVTQKTTKFMFFDILSDLLFDMHENKMIHKIFNTTVTMQIWIDIILSWIFINISSAKGNENMLSACIKWFHNKQYNEEFFWFYYCFFHHNCLSYHLNVSLKEGLV